MYRQLAAFLLLCTSAVAQTLPAPAVQTQPPGDSSNKAASTAFVTTVDVTKAPLASPAFTGVPTAPTASQGNNSNQLATTAYIDTGLAFKAPLASPAFTGTPTAPTAAPGTSTTQLATTAFVTSVDILKAPLASPVFTGIPTAPTASQGNNSTQLATTAYVDTGLALKAPLASPALTGVPTAPTATQGNNSTQLATTAYADAGLALKAPLASPALTGTPTSTTPATADNTTKIATTAYVQSQGYMKFPGITSGTRQGNTSVFGTTSGSFTPGNCVASDASGNLVDAGACGGTTTLPWFSVKSYNASGSSQVTTGTTNGTAALTLASALDFVNGQGIRINAAGPATTVSTATSPSAVYTGTAGSTTYSYRISAMDNSCGMKAATTAVTASSGVVLGSLGYTNFITLNWTAGAGATRYAIWRSVAGGAYSFLTIVSGTTFKDGGFNLQYTPDCVPALPPAADQAQWLVTTVSSGAGTTSLVLANAATQSAAGLAVAHDDTVAVNAAIIAGGVNSSVLLPCGDYHITNSINITASNQAVVGLGACSNIYGHGANDDVKLTGVSQASSVNNNRFSDINFQSYGKFGGKTLNARFFFSFVTENVNVFNPWGGFEAYNFNSLNMLNWAVYRFWGSGENGYLFHSGPTGDSACCIKAVNLIAVGLSKYGGFSGIMTDKTAMVFDGNVQTVYGSAWSLIEAEGMGLFVGNSIGNAANPQFLMIHGMETEYTNDRAIYLTAGQNYTFSGAQTHGARDSNIVVDTNVNNVNFFGGYSTGAKTSGFYLLGDNITIGNMQIYDNSNVGSGGTLNSGYGIDITSSVARISISNVTVGTPATATQQTCGINIQAGVTHFNISGVSSADSNVAGGACNAAGTSTSKIVSVAN